MSMGKVLKKVITFEFLLGGLLAIMAACLALTGPLVIREVLNFIKLQKPTVEQEASASWYTSVWVGLFLLKIFISEYADRLMFTQAVKIE